MYCVLYLEKWITGHKLTKKSSEASTDGAAELTWEESEVKRRKERYTSRLSELARSSPSEVVSRYSMSA